jgi:hypothetical protein
VERLIRNPSSSTVGPDHEIFPALLEIKAILAIYIYIPSLSLNNFPK